MWLCVLVLKVLLTNTLAYNLDITNAIVLDIPRRLQAGRNSYFGFSTALYTSSKNDSAVLIGAPRGNASYLPSVSEPGLVYACTLNNTCKEWIIDKSENGMLSINSHLDIKMIRNNSWIGATIATDNTTDPRVIICAPRWINHHYTWFTNGMCYWTRTSGMESFNKEPEFKVFPLSDSKYQISDSNINYAFGQVGFSIHISPNKLSWNVVLGAPGTFVWTGTPVLLTTHIQVTDVNVKTIVPNNKFSQHLDFHNYFGFSSTSGCYFKKGEYWFASSAPQGANMYGKIIIYKFPAVTNDKITVKSILKGQKFGEYFGATLASCDLNNDGRDDLIVGAPLWTRDLDEGRVYVFIAWQNDNFEAQIIEGEVSGGRFGSSLTCFDADYDGYGDIIIGAPYESDTGAIYLYNGDKNGVSKKYSQKILGSQVSKPIRGFGISISEPRDMNGDKYLDVAVGAYLSEQAVLFTSKPVISIIVNLVYSSKKLIKISRSFVIDICTVYNGVYAPKNVDIIRTLEVDSLYGRATYLKIKTNNSTYVLPSTLKLSERQCEQFEMNVNSIIKNVFEPITISVVVDLAKTVKNNQSTPAEINKLLSKTEDTIKLPFNIECGEDNVCHTDLQIILETDLNNTNTYFIGSQSNLKLIIKAYNKGEPAYQSQVRIFIPSPLTLASMPLVCLESTSTDSTLQIVCDIGNPLETNETVIIELDTSKVRFDVKELKLYANATTQSEEINPKDNNYTMTVYFDIDVDIAIAGKAQEDLYSYFKEDEKPIDSIRFQHIYEVQKYGVSPINEAVLTIQIPTHWKNNDKDIELISINQTIAHMDGDLLECDDFGFSKYSEIFALEDINEVDGSKDFSEDLETNVTTSKLGKIVLAKEKLTSVPPENRTLFMNCTNPMILCRVLKCQLNSFTSSLSVAKLILTLDLLLPNFQPSMLENKDIIYFVSGGFVNITQPPNVIQRGHKPDSTIVATTFLGAPVKERIAGWIVALSIFLGIVLLTLIILGLVKLGFFRRKKKAELEALKAMSSKKDPLVLETTSGEIALD